MRTTSHNPPRRRRARPGHTLIELVASMGSATLLMVGLASTLYVSGRALEGGTDATLRSDAADVQADVMNDLTHATGFTTRGSDSITFDVPDRDGDSVAETITYAWTGLPTAELTYSINGGAAATLLEDVQDFQFTFLDRFMAGTATQPPSTDPDEWGERWQPDLLNFGFETQFGSSSSNSSGDHIATRVTLPEDGTVQSITGYFTIAAGERSDVGFAIYSVDGWNNPEDLIVETAKYKNLDVSGWLTLPVTPTLLTAGEYYLAHGRKDNDASFHYEAPGGESHFASENPLGKNGWEDEFNSDYDLPGKISIYATYTPE